MCVMFVATDIRSICSALRRFARSERASTAVIFGVAFPVAMGMAGIAVDYSMAAATRAKMQTVADAAAINSAREFQMARATAETVAAAAQSYVASQLKDVTVTAAVDEQALSVQVVIEKDMAMRVGK